jgi:hypothetical protein
MLAQRRCAASARPGASPAAAPAAPAAPVARRGAQRGQRRTPAAPRAAPPAAAVRRLLDLAEGTARGVSNPPGRQAEILAAVEELKRVGAGQRTGAPVHARGRGWG